MIQKAEPSATIENAKQSVESSPISKVDYATDLFDMLSMHSPTENGSTEATADDNSWAGFQCMLNQTCATLQISDSNLPFGLYFIFPFLICL